MFEWSFIVCVSRWLYYVGDFYVGKFGVLNVMDIFVISWVCEFIIVYGSVFGVLVYMLDV